MPQPRTASASRRSDAEQNRARILAAARDAFAEAPGDVSMAEVSRRAGVGMATLYRNFADRRELLEAVYVDEVDAVVAAASSVQGATDGKRLEAWLREFFTFITSKRRVAAELLEHTDRSSPLFGGSRARVTAAGLPLFRAAQVTGQVRDDLNFEQVIDMVHAIARVPGERQTVEPMLQTVLDGLGVRA